MAEQYMSRRERKEAEKRAADAQKLKEEASQAPVAKEPAQVSAAPAKPQTPPQPQQKSEQKPAEKEPVSAEPPQFASRAERKAWMRKHGQAPAIGDDPDLTLRRQSKQEPTPAPKETEAEKAEVKKPEAQKTATKKPEAKKPEPKKPESPKSASKAAEAKKPEAKKPEAKKPEAKKPEAKKPVPAKPTTQPGVAQSAAKAPAEKKPADKKPVEKPAEQKKDVEKKTTPEQHGGSKPAAPRSRKAPVVKPPNTEGIRVVSGAVPVVSTEDKENTNSQKSTKTSQADMSQDPVSSDEARTRAASCVTRPLESVDEDPEVTREEWPLNDAIGAVQPMSARSVTNQDGDILVGERSSVLPYIVLGVGGLCAIVLVVVALVMLF